MTGQAPLGRLFRPDSVAIIGASDDPGRISGRPLRYLLQAGYQGAIYPINPGRSVIQGVPCFASVEVLPAVPDVALIALPAPLVLAALQTCADKGIRAVILMSAGFAETGVDGLAAQAELQALAARSGMRVLGPNCLGVFNTAHRFFGTFATSLDRGFPALGSVAVASQSGAYGQHIAYLARIRGLGVSHCITTGNEMDVDVAEAVGWLAQQPEVKVIMAYCEGVPDGGRLIAALKMARHRRVAVIFMKVGRSEAGTRAAASHTAALAGSDAVFAAVLRQFGAWRAETTEQQVDIAEACAGGRFPSGNRLAIVTVSGGAGVQIADQAERRGLDVVATPDDLRDRLQSLLPFAAVGNPLDITGQVVNDPSLLQRGLEMLCEAATFDALIVYLTTVPLDRTVGARVRDAVVAGLRGRGKMPVALCMIGDPEMVRAFQAGGLLVFEDAARAVAAMGALAAIARAFERDPLALPADRDGDRLPSSALSEPAAKRLLASWGVPVLSETLAGTEDEAVAAAARIGGKVVMKIASADIAHKTEIGGVLLDVAGEAAVRGGFRTLLTRAGTARLEGVLVAPMAPPGVEMIAGALWDPVFGPVVMTGPGGVLVEVMQDVSFRVAPFAADEAARMIAETGAGTLLAGVRGAPPADGAALARCLAKLSRFAAANADTLGSVEINPLLVLPAGQGVVALDAAVSPRKTPKE